MPGNSSSLASEITTSCHVSFRSLRFPRNDNSRIIAKVAPYSHRRSYIFLRSIRTNCFAKDLSLELSSIKIYNYISLIRYLFSPEAFLSTFWVARRMSEDLKFCYWTSFRPLTIIGRSYMYVFPVFFLQSIPYCGRIQRHPVKSISVVGSWV